MKENDNMIEQEIVDEAATHNCLGEEVQSKVFEIVEDLCLMPIQDANVTLIGDLALDSLRMVMLLVTLEDTFEIELDESDMNPFALITVSDVISLVMKYVFSAKEDVDNA